MKRPTGAVVLGLVLALAGFAVAAIAVVLGLMVTAGMAGH